MKLLTMFTLFSFNLAAQDFKIRAREHYEIHRVKMPVSSSTYRGLTNTINLWWEIPYDYSIGFSFSPIFGSAKTEDSNSTLGNKITQQNIGFEYKSFHKFISDKLFTRIGAGYSKLKTQLTNEKLFFGRYMYIGIGAEIPLNKFGLALELAYRHANYQDDLEVKTISPSIGFHLYKSF